MKKESNRNHGLDLLKLLCAFLVVVIHFPPEIAEYELLIAFCRVAVPVFFLINGFFWETVDCGSYQKGWKRIKNLFLLTAATTAVYVLYDVTLHLLDHTYVESITAMAEWRYRFTPIRMITLLFFNDPGIAYQCWYMLALIYTYAVVMFFQKRGKSDQFYKYAPFLAVANYLICLAAEYIIPQYNNHLFYRNWLFMALPFFSMGVVIGRMYKNKREWLVSKRKVFLIACVLILPFYFVEVQAINKLLSAYFEVYISTIVLSLLLFLTGLTNDVGSKALKLLSAGGAKISTSIYCCHVMVGSILTLLTNLFAPGLSEIYGILKPFVVFLVSLLISVAYYKLKAKIYR